MPVTRKLQFPLEIASVLFTIFLACSSEAALITGSSGYTAPGDTNGVPQLNATVNFAVFDQIGGSLVDTWNAGVLDANLNVFLGDSSPALDTSAGTFLYVYQFVDYIGDIRSATINFSTAKNNVTSWGWFSGIGLYDGSNVSSSNPFGTPDSVSFSANAPAMLGVPSGVLAANTGLKDPFPGAVVRNAGSISVTWSFSQIAAIQPNEASSLIFFTSKDPPNPNSVTVQDGASAQGTIISPGAVPEPTSFVVWSVGLALVAGVNAVRRRKVIAT